MSAAFVTLPTRLGADLWLASLESLYGRSTSIVRTRPEPDVAFSKRAATATAAALRPVPDGATAAGDLHGAGDSTDAAARGAEDPKGRSCVSSVAGPEGKMLQRSLSTPPSSLDRQPQPRSSGSSSCSGRISSSGSSGRSSRTNSSGSSDSRRSGMATMPNANSSGVRPRSGSRRRTS
ncbi:unnamed protein product, partial [Laminaria digitata]